MYYIQYYTYFTIQKSHYILMMKIWQFLQENHEDLFYAVYTQIHVHDIMWHLTINLSYYIILIS